ncbi:MAG: SpoIID/LytB domain-containing protein [Bacteroidota bacterium]|nr:SpoIID/LytB domain-containing protein [Bacteroidota bacterium]
MKRFLFILSFLFLSLSGMMAKDIKVRLFSNKVLAQTIVTPHTGKFHLLALDRKLSILDTVYDVFGDTLKEPMFFIHKGNRIEVRTQEQRFGDYEALMLVAPVDTDAWIIKGAGPERIYSGKVCFRIQSGEFQVINIVDLETYVAGVVESEGGHVAEFEYLKAQAIMARTFALKNLEKHLEEGYNLKDDVTSQVYLSKAYLQNKDMINQAVRQTRDSVLVTEKGELVFGAFHSNSGGQTANSEEAWSQPIDYLRSRTDSFSLGQERSTWTVTLDKEKFVAYFARWFGVSINEPQLRKEVVTFSQPQRRSVFTYKNKELPLKYVRKEFGLRSTYFSVQEKGDKVILNGRGFGHGVGMSQEGAMEMSRRGYDHKQILSFYFRGTRLEDYHNIQGL